MLAYLLRGLQRDFWGAEDFAGRRVQVPVMPEQVLVESPEGAEEIRTLKAGASLGAGVRQGKPDH
ncbi:MAG: hypothetical protein ACUVRY_01505 [Thermoanaerobaculaceae bacterium]